MKPEEEKDMKQSAELNEDELDGVTGGLGMGFGPAGTMQYRPDMQMGAETMDYRPGANPMQAQTLEQKVRNVNPVNPANQPKRSGGAHSL